MKKYLPVDPSRVKTYSIKKRPTKVQASDFAGSYLPGMTLPGFLDSLPHILKANDLRAVVCALVNAHRLEKPVILGIGGHVIKCGLSPLIIKLMEQGLVSGICMNGGASIHDFEIAMLGRTSEEVTEGLADGMFGMVAESPAAMNAAICSGAAQGKGMGAALGQALVEQPAEYSHLSILASGVRCQVPVTVHVSIGGDTIHMHPGADGAAIGQTSLADFYLLAGILQDLGSGGVYINIGSAVVLPEVFLKALNLARNLSSEAITGFTTVNMDMIQHYRPLENVIRRPAGESGQGYTLTGHHEIMVPLLFYLYQAGIEHQENAHEHR